jgi:putative redox protein
MAILSVELNWVREEMFVARDRQGTSIVVGRTPESEEEWRGVKASDLLVMSLISCSASDVIGILQKQRQKVTSFRVSADAEQDDDPPWRFRAIHLHYRFSGRKLNENQVKRAIELSQEKYCSVYATLRDAVKITSNHEITEE